MSIRPDSAGIDRNGLEADEQPADSTLKKKAESKLQPGDFYYDGPYFVFTEQYHLRRGACCESGCRHCPYGFQKNDPPPK